MANNAAAYQYFVGFKFDSLSSEDKLAVQKGVAEGYLRIDHLGHVRLA